MLKEKLNESVKMIDKDLDFLATSSTIDVKNIIANSKDLLRIIYFFNSGYYYIARNTYEETHTSLMRYLYFNHIEPEEAFEYDSYLKDVFLLDGICLVATPKDKIITKLKYGDGEFNIIVEDGFNYGYEYENHLILFRDFEKNSALDCPLFKSEKLKLYEEFKDEVSEDTLKKRRKYYLTHGITTNGLLESSELKITTPYMLRRDGKLLECGDYHPYIKSYRKESTEETKKYLSIHQDFLKWFYDNTLDEEIREVISNLKYTQEEIDKLWYLTNQEFCRVRTSNYRYKTGGNNGEIYFRISSEDFNWFDLIWNVCIKFIHSIDYVTIMKDPQAFGKQFDYIKIKDTKINKLPIKDFIELDGKPLVESQVIKEPSFENNYHYGRVWATNSTSEMKSAILSSAISLRILYDRKQKLYIYGAAEDYIHRELLDMAWEFGLYPQYKARWQVTEGHFEDYTTQLIFAPTSLVNETAGASIGEDGYTDRIVYDFGVIIGREENRDECLSSIPLIKSLKNKQIKHEVFDGWEDDTKPKVKIVENKQDSQNLTEVKFLMPYDKNKISEDLKNEVNERYLLENTQKTNIEELYRVKRTNKIGNKITEFGNYIVLKLDSGNCETFELSDIERVINVSSSNAPTIDNSSLQPIPREIEIKTTKEFDSDCKDLKLLDKKDEIKEYLYSNKPDASLGGGLYKIRVKIREENRGQSGSYRVIFFYKKGNICYILTIYAKNQKDNITEKELKELKQYIEKIIEVN